MTSSSPLDCMPLAGGEVALVPCPGRQDAGPRSLADDLEALVEWGASSVLTLIEPHEMLALGVPDLRAGIRTAGMVSHHLPITDMCAPDQRFEAAWPAVRRELLATLSNGGRVVVHCRGGLGRAGTVTAGLLVEQGATPEGAIEAVRAARPGAIETAAQMEWIRHRGPMA